LGENSAFEFPVLRLLAECGAEVKVAASGASALALLKDARPDILHGRCSN